MRHFPVFLSVAGRRIVLAGGGAAAIAKLRLLMKSEARIEVFADKPAAEIEAWAASGRLVLARRALAPGDVAGAALFYAASGDGAEDARTAALARAEGALVNVVDNLGQSDFLTPAIVDRDPVTVAVGTEGAAPVLARAVKAEVEALLAPSTGALARAGQAFRAAAEALPQGRPRREFWAAWYATAGPDALARGVDLGAALRALLTRHLGREREPGRVVFVGGGPGDPDLLTLKARRALDQADVVIHDHDVAAPILELARREATVITTGGDGVDPATRRAAISDLLVRHAADGALVVRIDSGDVALSGRLDEEIGAVEAAGLDWTVVPGITAASAALAGLAQSLSQIRRGSDTRHVNLGGTGHAAAGPDERDWHALARPGEVTAIHMGRHAARFVQGRLLMHGADPATPIGVVGNASRDGQRILQTTLARLPEDLSEAGIPGPAVVVIGLAARGAAARTREIA